MSTHHKEQGLHPNQTISRENYLQIEDIQDKDYDEINQLAELSLYSPSQTMNENNKSERGKFRKKNSKNIKLQPYTKNETHRIQLQTGQDQEIKPDQKQDKRQINVFENEQENSEKEKKLQRVKIKKYEVQEMGENKNKRTKFSARFHQIESSDQECILQIDETENIKSQTKNSETKKQNKISQNLNNNGSQKYNQTQQQNMSHETQRSQQIEHQRFIGQRVNITEPKVFIIKRDRQWLNKIWPQFNMRYRINNQHFVSAKVTGNNAACTFILSKNQSDFTENGPSYIGKVKANFIGNVINIYGPGYNPTDYKNKNVPLRNIMATVEYETNFFGNLRPRNFKVFILKPRLTYYKDLEGPIEGEDEIPLNQLYERPINQDKIFVLQNRKPQWNENLQGYMINFEGRVKKPSIKNFILEDQDNPDIVRVIFGKINDNQYRLDTAQHIDPIVGFGIALSTFGGKIGCQ